MKKLFILLFAASLALTIQAQDITNTLGADGHFYINNSTPAPVLDIFDNGTNHFQFKNVGSQSTQFELFNAEHNLTLSFNKSEGTAEAPTDIENGHFFFSLGEISFNGRHGSYIPSATIQTLVDGTIGSHIPGKLVFSTSSTNAGLVDHLVIKSDGKVGIGTDAPESTLDVAGSVSKPITIKTAHYTAGDGDYTIIFTPTSNVTLSLPAATTCEGRIYVVRNTRVGSSTDPIVTIVPDVGEVIDGVASISVGYNQILPDGVSHSVTIQSDGTGWWVISATMYNNK